MALLFLSMLVNLFRNIWFAFVVYFQLIAQRLQNIRPTRNTSRDVLLRTHKEYFVNPLKSSIPADFEIEDLLAITRSTSMQNTYSRSMTPLGRPKTSAKRDSLSITTSASAMAGPQNSNRSGRPKTAMSDRFRAKSACGNTSARKYHEYPYVVNAPATRKPRAGLVTRMPPAQASTNSGDEFHFRRRPSTANQSRT